MPAFFRPRFLFITFNVDDGGSEMALAPSSLGELVPRGRRADLGVRRAARRLGNLYDDALAAMGLKATQVALLSEIERMMAAADGQSPALQDLASNMAVQISALTHALRPLVRDGLIELQPDETDKRVKRAVLTSVGGQRLREAIVHWARVNQRVDDVLGKDSAASLRALADFVGSDDFMLAYDEQPTQSGYDKPKSARSSHK